MTTGVASAPPDAARSDTRVTVSVLHAPTLAVLVEQLGDPSDWVVADLSLGAWRTRQAAAELAEQLGLEEPPARAPRPQPGGDWLHTYADMVGAGIESEAQGDLGLLAALDAAARIADAADELHRPPVLLVIAPLPGVAWDRDDRQLVESLAAREPSARWRLVVGFTAGSSGVPREWAAHWLNKRPDQPARPRSDRPALVPGITRVARANGACDPGGLTVALRNGRALVAPEARRPPARGLALSYDALLASVPRDSWVAAYAQCFCNNLFVNPGELAEQAGIRFGEGGGELALRLLDRAVGCARSPAERAGLLAQLQGMRIGLRRYADAASAADPSPATPPVLAGFLHQMKGWGLALSGGPEAGSRAVLHLDAARRLLDGQIGEREWLYLLNIEALGRVAVRDAPGALERELEIQRRVSRLRPPDRRLEYVNSLNLARLARRRGAGDAARRLYEQAFATTSGVRSESDAFYANLCHARLEADLRRPRESLFAWVRCALHWLSCAAPQAVSRRAVATLLGAPCDADGRFVDDTHRSLSAALAAAAGDVDGLVVNELDVDAPRFARTYPPGACDLRGIGAPGLGVIAANRHSTAERTIADGEAVGDPGRALRARTRDLLAALVPTGALAEARLIVAEDNAGRELPATPVEMVDACLRAAATRVAWADATFELPETVHPVLVAMSRVALGPAVESLRDGRSGAVTVSFRRYRSPATLRGADADLARSLANRPTVAELTADGSVDLAALRRLERHRVVLIAIEEDACTAAGIRLPTSATS